VSVFRRVRRLPDQETTRRLYEQATGVDRDRANADLALVADRLSPLVNAPDRPHDDALVLGAPRASSPGWQQGGPQMSRCRPLRPRSRIGCRSPKMTPPPRVPSWRACSPMPRPGTRHCDAASRHHVSFPLKSADLAPRQSVPPASVAARAWSRQSVLVAHFACRSAAPEATRISEVASV